MKRGRSASSTGTMAHDMSNAAQYMLLPSFVLRHSPYSFTLREEVRKAAYSIKNFMLEGVIKDQSIPLPLLTNAQGIAVCHRCEVTDFVMILNTRVEGTKSLMSEKRLLQQRLDEASGRIFALERQLADQQMRTEVAMQSSAKAPASSASHKFKNLTLQVLKTKRNGGDDATPSSADHMKKDEEIYKLRGKTNEARPHDNSAAVLAKIMDVSYELLHCERVSLFVKIQGENDLFVAHANDAARGQYISIDKGIAGLVARTGQAVTTNNVEEHPCFDKEMDERTGHSTKKLLCVPVKDPDGTILAVVQAVNKIDRSDFSVEDTLFLNYIAEVRCILPFLFGFKRTTRCELMTRSCSSIIIAKRLTDVRLKLSDYVLNHSDIHSLTDLIMVHGKAIMVCRSDLFAIALLDEMGGNELWITSNNGNLGDQVTLRQPIYKGISGLVATTGDTVCTRDALDTHSLFDPTHDNLTGYRTTSVLCMPVFEEHVQSKPKVVAVAMCINKLQGSQVISFNSQDKLTMQRYCKEIQYALGQMSLEVCYFKVLTEAGIISSLLQKHSRNTSGIMTNKLDSDRRVADDVFAHEVKMTQRPELDSWDLDILSFSFTEVIQSVQTIFRAYGFVETYAIPQEKMQSFVASVAQHYRANSYHNFYHAFQVLHAAHIQLKVYMRKLLTGLDIFALMIAAICHDAYVDHPGNNNDFEVKCVSSIALTHNDDAVLERHHCRVTFLILNTPSTNILEKVTSDAFRSIRRTIIRCIMATDMANHFTQCKALENMSRHQFQDPSNRFD
ncbi:hypothetical protein DYB32_002273 [Aphanomyces invadans]|uniref:PDEase domain-containing protein n=1 Tax=Aphanomyces invadans TaxID=157072 RepID=A0A3R6Z801_9STRA|nr:hypothetical protein DYB32_002273 [Aphanomyces invadans]